MALPRPADTCAPLPEYPGLSQAATGFFALDLFANAFDERTNPLLKDVEIGFANESRVPDMDHAVDRLVDGIDY